MRKYFIYLVCTLFILASCSKKNLPVSSEVAGISVNIEGPKLKSLPTHQKKKDFRGVWIQTAWQARYQQMSPSECQTYLTKLIDDLYHVGFNAVIFQVRPEGDAFYESEYEPWSRFLTGVQGKKPEPAWDPMAYIIELCHKRNMEFHAWMNPYRMSASNTLQMDSQHLYYKKPEWFVKFDNKLYLNPGLPECRSHIRTIVKDIISRYDVDAIHFDDYFYPYPVAGKTFDDTWAFENYAPLLNIDKTEKDALGNFRRRNVDILIKSIHEDIKEIKPEVRFGISPFGIYRNKKAWEGGSETNGTQCYDDLYANILFWAQAGWIDYVIPQIYWEIGHVAADYSTLVKWWDENTPKGCDLYIGQSIERSLDISAKNKKTPDFMQSNYNISRKLSEAGDAKNVKGNCFWYAYQIEDNSYRIRDYLFSQWNKFVKRIKK